MAPQRDRQNPSTDAIELSRSLVSALGRRWRLIMLIVAAAIGLAFVYHRTTPPLYESSAQILIVKRHPDSVAATDARPLSVDDYVAAHQTLLQSPLLIDKAIHAHQLQGLDTFHGAPIVSEAIALNLTVVRHKAPGGNTENILDLYFHGPNAQECPRVLSALLESFQDHLAATYRKSAEEALRLIRQARSEIQKELTEQEASYRKFRRETPLLVLKGKDDVDRRQERLGAIEAKRSTLLLRRAELQGQLAVLKAEATNARRHDALIALVASWTAQGEAARGIPATAAQDRLLPLLAEEQKLLETRGEKHPEVELLRKRIQATRELLAAPAARWHDGLSTKTSDSVAAYQDYCQQELNHIEVASQYLGDLYQKEQARIRDLVSSEIEDEGFRVAIERQQRLYDGVVKQLQQVDLVKDLGGYEAQVLAAPSLGKKIRPNALILFPAAIFLGLMGGLGLALLAEWGDQRLLSADEVRQLLGIPVLARIPKIDGSVRTEDSSSVAAQIVSYHHPESVASEAFRRIQAIIDFERLGSGGRAVQVTSPNEGEGTTLLAENLAVTLARSGRHVVLVDANFRDPKIHEGFGLPRDPGLSDVLAREAKVTQCLRTIAITNLEILPAGAESAVAIGMLGSPGMAHVLEALRERFDYVIVDSPAVLPVADALAVARHVDGVLLNVRLGRKSRSPALCATTLLQELGVRVVGAVANDAGRGRSASRHAAPSRPRLARDARPISARMIAAPEQSAPTA